MSKRRISTRWVVVRNLALLGLIGWLVFEGRFFIPKSIHPPEGIQSIEVEMTTTSYCHCRKCCSYKWLLFIPYQKTGFMRYRVKHVGMTSSGAMVRPGSIAADTSIYPYGTVMYIPGYGYGRVEDTGGAIKGQHIDVYRPNHWFARQWGVQTLKVKVWLLPEEEPVDPPVPERLITNSLTNLLHGLETERLETNGPGDEAEAPVTNRADTVEE